jgi:arsenite-transporting ATPase
MPPTAVALRFFNLPSLSLIWLDQLEKLRLEIYKKKEIISRIKFAGKEFEKDKVLNKIKEIKETYLKLKIIFQNKENKNNFTGPYIIFNHDLLSINETKRIINDLENFDIPVQGIICNNKQNMDLDHNLLKTIPLSNKIKFIPFSREPLIGEQALNKFINSNQINIVI